MCKVMIFTDLSKVKNLSKLTNTIQIELGKTERDGFGFSLQSQGGVYSERSLMGPTRSQVPDYFSFCKKKRESEGQIIGKVTHGIFHGRTSTNDVSLLNTHPINKNGWSLIHNGVVSDHGPKYPMRTTNDTEHVVQHLSIGGIDAVAKNLTGYYAVGALAPNGQLHVFRDAIAPLMVSYIESIDSYVFATTESLIRTICKSMQWKFDPIQEMQDDMHLIFDGNTVISQKHFVSRGFERNEAVHAEKSLGRTLELTDESKHDFRAYESDHTWREYDEDYMQDADFFNNGGSDDDDYIITTPEGIRITLRQFDKMDQISQDLCTIRKAS